MTTLDVFYRAFGWKQGTLHDAKQRFAIASPQEMQRCCTLFAANIRDIADPREVLWFMKHRREAIKLHIQEC